MSEERQQLLEQKRKRLQELKQRRNAQTFTQVFEKPEGRHFGVSVGTQTTNEHQSNSERVIPVAPTSSESQSRRVDPQVTKFDVGIQVASSADAEVDESNDEKKTRLVVLSPPISKKEISTHELNDALLKSIKLINQLQIHHLVDLNEEKVESRPNTSFVVESHLFKLDRRITDVDVSSHKKDQFVVSFAKSSTENYDAIVFDQVRGKLVPINYLTCIPAVSKIGFDVNSPNRVIGSSSNGGLCIWETHTTSLMHSPTLSTPSTFLIAKRDWIPHLDALVLLQPLKLDTNECILTMSKEGVLNIWSSNVLSRPKYSIKLCDDESKKVRISKALYLGSEALIGEINQSALKMVLAGFDGKLYNESWSLIHEDEHESVINSLETVGKNLVITAHSDWNLRLWKEEQVAPFKVISTAYVVNYIVKRPHMDYQFITVGTFKQKFHVDFWDLSKKVYAPLLKIVEEVEPVLGVKFTGRNGILIVKKMSLSLHLTNEDYNWQLSKNSFDKGL
ncbi:hypothetical protein KGF57_001575 [Candida theae]|uniref:Uncharacterized protein n=1 Tax=Candida theae TaxID=1198502 RepID=A0AAD5BGX0_9ASCO|nr:uncharacterized protein KGF57_001575 [Candida theae]KAI5961947.1 hypothetical protein KGF57_001575 [Candida theae]